ncbi:MAG: carbohydrate ABC transporter permease [Sphaerochaetaceae bacterium]|nr:carbohydrate ABC transporter permease [Sphaerochaetaceae bacterium]
MNAKKRFFDIFQTVICILLVIILIYPLVWMVGAAFKTNEEIFTNHSIFPQKEWMMDTFAKGWKGVGKNNFTVFFKNTLIVTIPSVLLTVISSTLTAYGFARFKFVGKNLLFMIMLGMLMLPNAVILIPTYLLFKDLGWLNTFLPIVIPTAFAVNSFLIFMLVQFFRSIPKEFDEAATIDGCNSFQCLTRVMVPMCTPAMITCGLFEFMWKWNDYFSSMIYLNSAKRFTIPLGLRLTIDSSTGVQWNQVMAMSIVSILPCVVVFFSLQKYFVDGIAAGGLKG